MHNYTFAIITNGGNTLYYCGKDEAMGSPMPDFTRDKSLAKYEDMNEILKDIHFMISIEEGGFMQFEISKIEMIREVLI